MCGYGNISKLDMVICPLYWLLIMKNPDKNTGFFIGAPISMLTGIGLVELDCDVLALAKTCDSHSSACIRSHAAEDLVSTKVLVCIENDLLC